MQRIYFLFPIYIQVYSICILYILYGYTPRHDAISCLLGRFGELGRPTMPAIRGP